MLVADKDDELLEVLDENGKSTFLHIRCNSTELI